MAIVTSGAGNHIIDPVVQRMSEVINHEDSHHILQIDMRRMEMLLQDIGFFHYQQKPPAENVKIWLQLLHNCVAEAKRLLHRSGSRRSCLDSVVRNPRRLSEQVREWKAFFNHLVQGFESEFQSDLFEHIVLSRNAINSHVVGPIIPLLNDVINKEDERQILQADLKRMESLQDLSTLFRYEPDTSFFQRQVQKAPLLTSFQLLQTCLAMARRLLDRPEPRPKSCLDCVVHNPRRLISKEIREWNAFYDEVYHGFQSTVPMLVTSLQFLSTKPLLQGVAASGFVGSGIMDAQAQVERWLSQGDRAQMIGVYGMPGVGKTPLLQMVYNKYKSFFHQSIWVRIPEDYTMFDLQGAIGRQIILSLPTSFDERKMKLSAYLKQMNFLLVLVDLWSPVDMQELGVAFGEGKHSKVLFSTRRKDAIGEMGAEESIEIQPLSRDEAWMQFRRVAFKDDQVPVDIQERALRFAEECKGVPLAINIVAAMIGQTPVDEWDTCFSLLQKNVDPSFPATHSGLDAQLYALLRCGYDALPHSDVKNCFLYCAMYKEDEEIDSRQLVEMWIGEGLVKSKEGTHLMDMAIGRSYLKLLLDRRFFHIVKQSNNVLRQWHTDVHDVFPSIRVHHARIHDMAVHIAQKEENCLVMGSQNLRNFPEAVYENCTRMSFADNYIGDLPTHLRCPKLASLILKGNTDLEELPSEFLLSLTSLRVLNLSGCTNITSVPTVVGQLRLLQFLSLSHLPIQDLPQEIGHLYNLQFLDLSGCGSLNSLPSQIGQLRNLKHFNLSGCLLKMIPREMSELTSLSRLQLSPIRALSVEMEAPASIWSLKGLKSLTELGVGIEYTRQKMSRIKDDIMGTWSEMRHLQVVYYKSDEEDLLPEVVYYKSDEEDLLPEDMRNMKKLQSFMLSNYHGLISLLNCKFEHLESVYLYHCHGITALSPLEQLPNLKLLKLEWCDNLRELGIGSPSGYVSLQKLVLTRLDSLESLGGASWQRGVWDERTLPQLRVLKMLACPSLKRFPRGMEKLPNLCALIYQAFSYPGETSAMEWWESIMWEDENMKVKLQQIFIARDPKY